MNITNKTNNNMEMETISKEEQNIKSFEDIKTFIDALDALDYDDYHKGVFINEANNNGFFSLAMEAMFKLKFINRALNKGHNMSLTESEGYLWIPYIPFTSQESNWFKEEIESKDLEVIGKFKAEGLIYTVLGGKANAGSINFGLGGYNPHVGVGFATSSAAFLTCATEKIAKHFSKHFGMLIIQAIYGDLKGFEILK